MNLEEMSQSESFRSKGEQRIIFFLVFMGVFSITYGILFSLDFLPEKPQPESETTTQEITGEAKFVEASNIEEESIIETNQTTELTAIEEAVIEEPILKTNDTNAVTGDGNTNPISIIFDSLEKQVTVQNPISRSIADLNKALLSGVVRHPDSADFDDEGTIFLFGHSSYLPKVINKNFQAFNGIQNLDWGDIVRLQSSDTEYVYRVDRVYQVKASDAEVKIERGTSKLTLATCNTFGSKDDRYIVEATLVDSYTI